MPAQAWESNSEGYDTSSYKHLSVQKLSSHLDWMENKKKYVIQRLKLLKLEPIKRSLYAVL